VVAVVQLYFQSKRARGTPYKVKQDLSFSYASRWMRWGGVFLVLFVVFHLLHLTTGDAHPAFDHESPFNNVVVGFQSWYVSLFYVFCMIPLGLHMYHGLWSITQTLSLQNPRVKKWRRPVAAAVAILVVLANISIPVAVLAGLVQIH
jgi:succinate dehydrogenase / fumarate reductase cytochrome b subunit